MSSMLCLVIFKAETNCELGHGVALRYSSYLLITLLVFRVKLFIMHGWTCLGFIVIFGDN